MVAKKKRNNKNQRLRHIPSAVASVEPLKETVPTVRINEAPDAQNSKSNNASTENVQSPANNKPRLRERMAEIEKWFKKQTTDIKINVVSALFEFVAIVIAFGLLCETGKQVTISRDTAKKQLRAYITVVEPYNQTAAPLEDRVGDRLEVSFFIINNGQTPAYGVGDSAYIEVRPKNVQLIMPNGTDQSKQFVASTSTRQERKTQSVGVLSKEQIAGLKSGDLRIFLWGKVTYKDIFDERHWTEFCYEYDLDQQAFHSYSNCNRAE